MGMLVGFLSDANIPPFFTKMFGSVDVKRSRFYWTILSSLDDILSL